MRARISRNSLQTCQLRIVLQDTLDWNIRLCLQSETHLPSISSRQVEVFHGQRPTQLNSPMAIQLISWNYWLFGMEMYSHQDLVKDEDFSVTFPLRTLDLKTHRKTALKTILLYGCFLKWWYPQNTPKWSFLVGKPMVVGETHHLRKHPCFVPMRWMLNGRPLSFAACIGESWWTRCETRSHPRRWSSGESGEKSNLHCGGCVFSKILVLGCYEKCYLYLNLP